MTTWKNVEEAARKAKLSPAEVLALIEPPSREPLFTTHDISEMLQCDGGTVAKWIAIGALKGFTTPGGHRRVTRASLRAFVEEHGMPMPAELAR